MIRSQYEDLQAHSRSVQSMCDELRAQLTDFESRMSKVDRIRGESQEKLEADLRAFRTRSARAEEDLELLHDGYRELAQRNKTLELDVRRTC